MKKFIIPSLALALLCGAALCGTVALRAQEMPEMPKPQKEHDWLHQLTGEWTTEAEIYMEPGQPPMKATGTESARMMGGFFLVADGKSEMMGMPYTSVFTLGYDVDKKKYVGTWIDSMTGYLWKYEGSVDSTGKILTLDTEGPCPKKPGELMKMQEKLELKSPDHRVFTSSMQDENGKWVTAVKVESKRKK